MSPMWRREEVITNIISLRNVELGILYFIGCGLGSCSLKGNRISWSYVQRSGKWGNALFPHSLLRVLPVLTVICQAENPPI